MEGMDEKLVNAVKNGDLVSFVDDKRKNEIESGRSEEYFLSETKYSKKNILHLAIIYAQKDFIEKVLKSEELLPRSVTDELIKQQDSDGDTPLHDAVSVGNTEFFKFLFEYQEGQQEATVMMPVGINVGLSMQNNQGNTPLHLSLIKGKDDVASLLAKHCSELTRSRKNNDGNTPLHVAAEVGHTECFKLLLEYDLKQAEVTNGDGNTPLHVALLKLWDEIATLLLERRPELVLVTNNMKETPLHLGIEQYRQIINLPIKKRDDLSSKYLDMIKLMIEKESCVACWQDATGATPLHRAASITSTYTLRVIRLILDKCPQSVVGMRDNSSKTFLHFLKTIPSYKEAKDLLDTPELFGLINHQDKDGNTPLHWAAMNLNHNMVRALLDSSAEQSIRRNNDGITAESLIQEQFEVIMEKKQMTMEVCKAIERIDTKFLKERLHQFGLIFLFPQDSKGRNVLHKLIQVNSGTARTHTDFVDLIQQVLGSFPELIFQVDHNGDTPLHILMQNSPDTTIRLASEPYNYEVLSLGESHLVEELLGICCWHFNRAQEEATVKGEHYDPPWLVQNVSGNTPIHEALRVHHGNEVIKKLLELDIEITAKLMNNLKETPLHLVGGRPDDAEPLDKDDINRLRKAYRDAIFTFDKNGLTPLLRAAQIYNVDTISTFLSQSPAESLTADKKYGKTLFHLLINYPSYSTQNLLKLHDIKGLLFDGDYEGNTPLHLAIQVERFDHAINFLQHMEPKEMNDLLEKKNYAGTTPSDLIRSKQKFPIELLVLLEKHALVEGILSIWDVPTSQIQEYANTMGVVAALIATITFTAAFTVPGGLVEAKGVPVLLGKAAFQVNDGLILFALGLYDIPKQISGVMDFSIILLLLSLYTTLVSFMMGVYVTTIHDHPWIAITTIILCSLLMLLMHKNFVLYSLVPAVKLGLVWFGKMNEIAISSIFCQTVFPRSVESD